MFQLSNLDTIAFDADDTLWHNEDGFHRVEARFAELLGNHLDGQVNGEVNGVGAPVDVLGELADVERRNVKVFGYGVKSFTFSMIETATRLTAGRIEAAPLAAMVNELIEHGRWLLTRPVEMFDGVTDLLSDLAPDFRLILVTKGDPHHQLAKVNESGVAKHFDHVEVVAEKDPDTYRELAARHRFDVETMLMVGNSLKSDVLPILDIGGHAVHIPYTYTWALEQAQLDETHPGFHRFTQIATLHELPALLR
jgi:putative hydrolase of the HAD superfamily